MMGRLVSGQARLFYEFCIEDRVPDRHLLRKINAILNLGDLHRQLVPFHVIDPQHLTRSQRLERWAMSLERPGDAPLRTLRETEHRPTHERILMREVSLLTVAFEDPVLRSAGLQDDTYGEARRFFDLPDWDPHNVLCYCHSGTTVRASEVARRVRSVEARAAPREFAALYYGGVAAVLAIGAGVLLAFAH